MYITIVLSMLNSCHIHAQLVAISLLFIVMGRSKRLWLSYLFSLFITISLRTPITESFRKRILCPCFLAWSIYINGPKVASLAATVHCKVMPNIFFNVIPRSPCIQRLSRFLSSKYFRLLYVICVGQFLHCGTVVQSIVVPSISMTKYNYSNGVIVENIHITLR